MPEMQEETDMQQCLCGPDHTGEDIDVHPDCPYHNPPEPAEAEIRNATAEAEMNGLYRDRAHLVAVLATHHPAVIVSVGADPAWPDYALIYLDTPAGQISWHIHRNDLPLFDHVETAQAGDPRARWDGHTKEQALARLVALAERRSEADRG